jgi:hypothetical protein
MCQSKTKLFEGLQSYLIPHNSFIMSMLVADQDLGSRPHSAASCTQAHPSVSVSIPSEVTIVGLADMHCMHNN